MTLAPDQPCPCGLAAAAGGSRRPRPYGDCCARWHGGPQHLQAPNAEALMRSRYTAYVLHLNDYLLATWHPSTRPADLGADDPGLKWLGLEVRRHRPVDDTHAEVEFVARSKLGGRAHRLHELSRFERVDGHWLYVDGSFPGR